jgi:hypothetical protein
MWCQFGLLNKLHLLLIISKYNLLTTIGHFDFQQVFSNLLSIQIARHRYCALRINAELTLWIGFTIDAEAVNNNGLRAYLTYSKIWKS